MTIDVQIFNQRRRNFMQQMQGGIAIIPTAPERLRNRDIYYGYRPDSDFYYLTGFVEPEAVAVFVPGRTQGEFILFCRDHDPEKEMWEGERAGPQEACQHFGADDAFPIEDIDEILPGLLEDREKVYYSMGRYRNFDNRLMAWYNEVRGKARAGVHAPGEFIGLDHILHEMRLIKDAEEIKVMRRVAKLSAEAHCRAMRACKPGIMEYQLEAELLYGFKHAGAQYVAYPPIVGAGKNACTLHYTNNRAKIDAKDLVLIDAGAELDGYAADISRTFPASGTYSDEQKAIYEIVLRAQRAAIEEVRPGKHWNDPHDTAVRVLTEGMIEVGLLKGKASQLIEEQKYKQFYMHRTGHWLGLDVHDVGDYKIDNQWRLLEPGMVLTVEPGLYIPASSPVDKRWWDIGVRIEDDVHVTRKGPEVLSIDAPKSIEDIEALMAV